MPAQTWVVGPDGNRARRARRRIAGRYVERGREAAPGKVGRRAARQWRVGARHERDVSRGSCIRRADDLQRRLAAPTAEEGGGPPRVERELREMQDEHLLGRLASRQPRAAEQDVQHRPYRSGTLPAAAPSGARAVERRRPAPGGAPTAPLAAVRATRRRSRCSRLGIAVSWRRTCCHMPGFAGGRRECGVGGAVDGLAGRGRCSCCCRGGGGDSFGAQVDRSQADSFEAYLKE